ncbi:MAG: hypothetical protein NT030_01295 [Candidatus Saganbacteria bacterium]|nr:hypothetical protein [Candidatus Saganbacteria bacterium]
MKEIEVKKGFRKVWITVIVLIVFICLCEATKAAEYTGLVIDAHGMGLEADFSLRVTSCAGSMVYGITDINYIYQYSYAPKNTVVNDLAKGWEEVVGNKPLVVRAVERIEDGTKNNLIIVALDGTKSFEPVKKNIVVVI